MGGHLIIKYNSVLESLSGLDNVIENSIGNLEIAYNESLTNCEASSICDYLAQPNGNIEIHDNATGCNSEAEVDSACVYLLNSNANDLSSFLIYPSPTSTSIKIELPGSIRPIKNTFLTINNIDGQQLIERQISELQTMVDVIGLDAGIYFVKVIMDDKVQVGKFVKE